MVVLPGLSSATAAALIPVNPARGAAARHFVTLW
jgi:hypothetical protein